MSIKTIFLDRDGVINKEINYLYSIDDFIFTEGIFDACRHFLKLGYQIIIITNQSGIARGFYNTQDYQDLTQWMLDIFEEKGIQILDIFYCPHGPKSNCECRKPKPGMILEAKNKHNINLKLSWMIGDSETDIKAASNSGIPNTILLSESDRNVINQNHSIATFKISSIKHAKEIIIV
jgi:D-glycero-D-manno-heptose 1,7-bisphosphate phosphatase